jgi:hydrogenase nickel incorporation protein HypA/HybF
MHELSITQAILDTALLYAEQAHAKTIRALDLRVGALSGIVPDSLRFYFDLINKGTLAEDARLEIELVPPRARCRACGAEYDFPFEADVAGAWLAQLESLELCVCGQRDYELSGGTGCYLDSMDVE